MLIQAAIIDIKGTHFSLTISSHHGNAGGGTVTYVVVIVAENFYFWDSHKIISHSLIPLKAFENYTILSDSQEGEGSTPYCF